MWMHMFGYLQFKLLAYMVNWCDCFACFLNCSWVRISFHSTNNSFKSVWFRCSVNKSHGMLALGLLKLLHKSWVSPFLKICRSEIAGLLLLLCNCSGLLTWNCKSFQYSIILSPFPSQMGSWTACCNSPSKSSSIAYRLTPSSHILIVNPGQLNVIHYYHLREVIEKFSGVDRLHHFCMYTPTIAGSLQKHLCVSQDQLV